MGIDASYRSTAPSDPAGVSAAELAQFPLVLGLDTFGDLTHDEDDRPLSHAQTIRNVVEQGVLAGQAGADFFGIGEHHADDFPMPGAGVVPGAIAARTTRIHLRSAVTVWSSDDPLRVASVTPRSTPSPAAGPKSSRTGLQHRLIPALRLQPRRLRGVSSIIRAATRSPRATTGSANTSR